jgi:hypothetical protein
MKAARPTAVEASAAVLIQAAIGFDEAAIRSAFGG